MFEFDQYLGFLSFLGILTIGFRLPFRFFYLKIYYLRKWEFYNLT